MRSLFAPGAVGTRRYATRLEGGDGVVGYGSAKNRHGPVGTVFLEVYELCLVAA